MVPHGNNNKTGKENQTFDGLPTPHQPYQSTPLYCIKINFESINIYIVLLYISIFTVLLYIQHINYRVDQTDFEHI